MIWNRLFLKATGIEKGTLLQLKNLIGRTNVPTTPKKNVHACEDFLNVVLTGYILAAAKEIDELQGCMAAEMNINERYDWFRLGVAKLVVKYVHEHIVLPASKDKVTKPVDGVLNYGEHLLSLGLLYMEFVDGIREGDGFRVMRCWRFFLPLFKSAKRKNYAIEALNLLMQSNHILPPRQAQQLIWSRFVNTRGWIGHNISCDLHMEHIIRSCKTALNAVGANITVQSLDRIGKCIGSLIKVMNIFDGESEVKEISETHSGARVKRDVDAIVKQLVEANVFKPSAAGPRVYPSFSKLPSSIYLNLNYDKLFNWMMQTVQKKFPVKK